MATQVSVLDTARSGQFNPETASVAGKRGAEAKRLKKRVGGDTHELIHEVLIQTLRNGKPADKLRAALALNSELGVMKGRQGDQVDNTLDKGIELLSSTAPEPTAYLSSDQVARIRAIGDDSKDVQPSSDSQSPHPSSQEVPPVSGGVTSSPKFFPSPDLISRLDSLESRLSQLTAAVEKLVNRDVVENRPGTTYELSPESVQKLK